MLQFKLSALVCSGIICIDLLASSPFCLLTSWIIREKETQGGKAGPAFEYFAGEMKSTWAGRRLREHYGLNRIFIFSHFQLTSRQVACFVQLQHLYLFLLLAVHMYRVIIDHRIVSMVWVQRWLELNRINKTGKWLQISNLTTKNSRSVAIFEWKEYGDWLLETCCFFTEVWNKISTNISVVFSLWRANDQVSEYEEMECMTLCAAVTISFPILNITHAHMRPWQGFSGIPCAWNVHFPILFWSDALIFPSLHATNTFSLRAPLAASASHFTLNVERMASTWHPSVVCRSFSMFSRNRTRVTALQEQCNMADVGS